MRTSRASSEWRIHDLIGALSILLALAAGLWLRLVDPLSNPVIPAEDPYTHMALVREHLRDGTLNPLYEGSRLYPPGMHAGIAAIMALSGLALQDIVRWGPVALGGLGILAVGAFMRRHIGALAGFVGALAMAVMPELVFRTTMMSPTAWDIAILPLLLWCLAEVWVGNVRFAAPGAILFLFVDLAHPWLAFVIALMAFVFLVLTLLFPLARRESPAPHPHGIGVAIMLVAAGLVGTLIGGTSFLQTIVVSSGDTTLRISFWMITVAAAFLAIPGLLLWRRPQVFVAMARLMTRPRVPLAWRAGGSVLLLAAIVTVTRMAEQGGLPELVNPGRMIGEPLLLLAAVGAVAIPFQRSWGARIGAALVVATYPLMMFNPLDSPFWPHRTVAFFGLGVTILGAAGAMAVLRVVDAAFSIVHTRIIRFNATRRRSSVGQPTTAGQRSVSAMASVLPLLLVVPLLGGGVIAGTPPTYGGWERLFTECEMEALGTAAGIAELDAPSQLIAMDYRSQLVLMTEAENASAVWLKPDIVEDTEANEDLMLHWERQGITPYVVVDPYARTLGTTFDLRALEHEPWQYVDAWCEDSSRAGQMRVVLYMIPEEAWSTWT